MLELGLDQAAGLRRLFVRPRLQLVPIVGAGRGDSVALASALAAALTRAGRRALVLDADRGEVAPALGLRTRLELLHVLAGECALEQAIKTAPDGFGVLSAGRGIVAWANEGGDAAQLFGAFAAAPNGYDVALLTARPDLLAALAPMRGHELLVVGHGSPDGMTAIYARVKQLSPAGFGLFRVVLLGVARRERGEQLFFRLASAARRFLGVSLVYGGGTEESHAYDRLAADLQEWQMPAFAARDASVH